MCTWREVRNFAWHQITATCTTATRATASRTTATKDNCHLRQLPPSTIVAWTSAT